MGFLDVMMSVGTRLQGGLKWLGSDDVCRDDVAAASGLAGNVLSDGSVRFVSLVQMTFETCGMIWEQPGSLCDLQAILVIVRRRCRTSTA
jgi:hypothetical protein